VIPANKKSCYNCQVCFTLLLVEQPNAKSRYVFFHANERNTTPSSALNTIIVPRYWKLKAGGAARSAPCMFKKKTRYCRRLCLNEHNLCLAISLWFFSRHFVRFSIWAKRNLNILSKKKKSIFLKDVPDNKNAGKCVNHFQYFFKVQWFAFLVSVIVRGK
jgi:hypothetical protein